MRVLCENCDQRYNINEDKLKTASSRFKCKKCSHYIIVTKPEMVSANMDIEPSDAEFGFSDSIIADALKSEESGDESPEVEDHFDLNNVLDESKEKDEKDTSRVEWDNTPEATASDMEKLGGGLSIQSHMSITFILGFLLIAATLGFINRKYLPPLINEQIDLRTAAISQSFSGAVKEPLLVRNYLRVNQEAERVSQLPGVAYTSVINKRNIVIAGVFAKPSLFEPAFLERAKDSGFPKELAVKNNLNAGEKKKGLEFAIGGQSVYDVAISLGKVGGEVHVGLFTADIRAAVKKTIVPMLFAVSVLFIFGAIGFSLLARFISKPVQEATEMADRISHGELDEQVVVKGPKEIRALGRSLDRMRLSIKGALKRLQK